MYLYICVFTSRRMTLTWRSRASPSPRHPLFPPPMHRVLPSLPLSRTHTFSLSVSVSLSVTHAHTLSLSLRPYVSVSFSLSLHTHTHSLSVRDRETRLHSLDISLNHAEVALMTITQALSYAISYERGTPENTVGG